MVKTNQFEYQKKVVNVMTYINCSQISCMTFKLLSKIKDIKRFAKSSDRYFLYARIYRVKKLLCLSCTDIHVGGVSRDGVKTSTLRYIFICN